MLFWKALIWIRFLINLHLLEFYGAKWGLLLEFNQNRTKKCAFLTFWMGINIADLKKNFFYLFCLWKSNFWWKYLGCLSLRSMFLKEKLLQNRRKCRNDSERLPLWCHSSKLRTFLLKKNLDEQKSANECMY